MICQQIVKPKFHGSDFLVASSRHPRRHARHARFPRDTLATSSPGCYEDATRKLLAWNFSFTAQWIGSILRHIGSTYSHLHATVAIFLCRLFILIIIITLSLPAQNFDIPQIVPAVETLLLSTTVGKEAEFSTLCCCCCCCCCSRLNLHRLSAHLPFLRRYNGIFVPSFFSCFL